MSNKLTLEAEAIIKSINHPVISMNVGVKPSRADFQTNATWKDGIIYALTNPELLQAQGLYTREEVRQMIADAFDAGHDRTLPGKHYAGRLLPSQPKTNTNEQ